MEKNGSPLPEFVTDDDHSFFITRLFIREGFYEYEDVNEGDNGGSTTPELPPSDPRSIIMQMVKENPKVKRKEIADRLGMTVDGVRYHLKKLTVLGVLKFEGNSKTGQWIILDDRNRIE